MTTPDAVVDPGSTGQGASTAVPTWFGPADRPLFGCVHVPDVADGRGVVLCPSLGLEGEASQFAFRSLAPALAATGCTVLRFDYDGTGDSAGLLSDPGRVPAWLDSVAAAIDFLREAGATQIHLVGARLGAVFAVRAAERDGDIASLSLWYPWSKGSQFLRYQRALRRMYAVSDDPRTSDGGTEIPGFVLDAEVTADLKALDGSTTAPGLPGTVLIVESADPDSAVASRSDAGADDAVDAVRRPGTGAHDLFGVELMRARVTPQDIDWIVESVRSTPSPPTPSAISPAIRSSAVLEAPDGGSVVERPVVFGTGKLFGICAEPGPDDPTGGAPRPRIRTLGGPVPRFTSALFLNAGSLHHVGPGRQWVELSRRWAAAGVRCLRMDIGGVGESPLVGPAGVLSSYPPSAIDDIAAAVQFLSPEDSRQVVVLGLCSGAYHALLAAPSVRIGGVAILNPLRLPASLDEAPGTIGDLIQGAPGGAWATTDEENRVAHPARRRFLGSLRDSGAFKPISKHIPDRIWWVANSLTRAGRPVDALRRVVDSGASLCVVLGPDEWPGIGRGRKHELRAVARRGVFSIAKVPTLDHNFHVASGRREAVVVLDQWVLGTGPAGRSTPPGVEVIG